MNGLRESPRQPVGTAALPLAHHVPLHGVVDPPDPPRRSLLLQRGSVAPSTAQGWSTRWYWGDLTCRSGTTPRFAKRSSRASSSRRSRSRSRCRSAWRSRLALTRWRGRTATASRFTAMVPVVTPEIVLGVALLLVVVYVFSFIQFGTTAQLVGHVTFSLAFVVIIVRGRLLSIGRDYEEAAIGPRRLAAALDPAGLVPMLMPAIVASFDDRLRHLDGRLRHQPVPVVGCSTDRHGPGARSTRNGRSAPTPALNALASLTLGITIVPVAARVPHPADRALGPRPARTRR